MTRIAPVRMNMNPHIYWFDAQDFQLEKDQKVVVKTVRGSELATVAEAVFESDESQTSKLKSPLKPIVRIATEDDIEQASRMETLGAEAMPIFRQFVEESHLDMRPVSVEYLLDGDKAVFYFESEERIDFRDLVRKLASHFHVRVDMRQIGVRDEARMIGGLGHCGQELCCARMGGDFNPVTIRMAKEQDLSLNPQKISGTCGRLMCCLRYEFDAYKDFNSRAPKKNATIQTPDGPAKVISLDVPREIVTVKLTGETEKTVKVPLCAFDEPQKDEGNEHVRPSVIGEEAWEDALSQDDMSNAIDGIFITSQFTREDKVGGVRATHNETGQKGASNKNNRGGRNRKQGNASGSSASQPSSDRKRRRRSTKITSTSSQPNSNAQVEQGAAERQSQRVRPGQKSSGLRSSEAASAKIQREQGGSSRVNDKKGRTSSKRKPSAKQHSGNDASRKTQNSSSQGKQQGARKTQPPREDAVNRSENGHRRSRRRSHKSGSASNQDGSKE